MVSRPTYVGGLGFDMKWDMGWMHDTLDYMQLRPDLPQVPPQRADVPPDVPVHRELRPAAVARRGRPRQGLAALEDAGRRLAEVREPAAAASPTCGRSPARSCSSWAARSASGTSGTTTRASTGTCSSSRATPALQTLGPRPEPPLRAPSPRSTSSTSSRAGFDWIDCHDADHSVVSFERRGQRAARRDRRGLQLHAGAALRLPRRRRPRRATGARSLNSDAVGVRRQRRRQPRARRRAGRAGARPVAQPLAHAAPARRGLPEAAAAGRNAAGGRRRGRGGGRDRRGESKPAMEPTAAAVDARARSRWNATSASTGTSTSRPARIPGSRRSRASPPRYPYHDWNERITAECYAPNADARILDGENRIVAIVNNYASMSFNFGPTLLSWLEEKEPEVYRAILDGGRARARGASRGHGSALAQAYNHMILPLANARDRRTQVALGHRATSRTASAASPRACGCRRRPSTSATLEALAEAGHPLHDPRAAPGDAASARSASAEWHDAAAGGDRPDAAVPRARCRRAASIAVFFYDGPISRAVAFERPALDAASTSPSAWSARFSDDAARPQLVHIATDGETYGHHHRHGDMALAYALAHARVARSSPG